MESVSANINRSVNSHPLNGGMPSGIPLQQTQRCSISSPVSAYASPEGDHTLKIDPMLLVELSCGTMLCSPLTWAVEERERRALAYLRDSKFPAD
jgi:hypothetical protein